MPRKEKQKKKEWKEKQRERQIKQQRAQEAYETQRAREAQKKPRKYPKGKMVFGICLIGLIFVAYVAWQSSSKPPSSTDGTTNNPPLTRSAPDFSLTDINGVPLSLSQQAGKVIAIHFMAVSCGGGIVHCEGQRNRRLCGKCEGLRGQTQVILGRSWESEESSFCLC